MEPDFPRIDPDRVNGSTIAVVDVRRHRHGEQIRGSVHYDARKLENTAKLLLPLSHEAPIAVYGDDDEQAATVVAALRAAGYAQAAVLNGGFEYWRELGYPVEDATQEQPIPGDESAGAELL
jgi:rhodanese-related sulfurtransferase